MSGEAYVFQSRKYPGPAAPTLLFGRALVQPLATCLLPVMVLTLTGVLQGFSILPYLLWGYPGAGLLAGAWTWFRLKTDIAEIQVRVEEGRAAARSIWSCAQLDAQPQWYPILDLRRARGTAFVTLGHVAYELRASEWPSYDALLEALREARLQAAINLFQP